MDSCTLLPIVGVIVVMAEIFLMLNIHRLVREPGLSLASYGAEQMAQACHKGEASVRSHMKGVAMNAVDPDNVKAMKLTVFADRRMTGIVI